MINSSMMSLSVIGFHEFVNFQDVGLHYSAAL